MATKNITSAQAKALIAELTLLLTQEDAPATCAEATLQGTPCKNKATVGNVCVKHTPEAIATRDANLIAREAAKAEYLANRAEENPFFANREVTREGDAVVIKTTYKGFITGTSRRDLLALNVKGVRKGTTVDEAKAIVAAHGINAVFVPALG